MTDDKDNVVPLFNNSTPMITVVVCNYCDGSDFTLVHDNTVMCSSCGADGLAWSDPEGILA